MAREDLTSARVGRNDEFYTQLPDIEKELRYYKQHFQGKVVLCNCDDPYESNFFKYFALNFNALGLKKLIATCYNGSPVSGNELLLDFGDTVDDPKKIAYKVEITEVTDVNGDGAINLADVKYLMQNDKNVISILRGNGDFGHRAVIPRQTTARCFAATATGGSRQSEDEQQIIRSLPPSRCHVLLMTRYLAKPT